MIKRLKKIANVFKPNKFHFALVDYLAEELRSNNINCRKKTSYIKIKLESKIEDKFDHVIVDCFNGGIYLRGENVKDKKVLKLNRFYGDREADAMHCARGGAKQVMKYLESLNVSKQLEVEANTKPNYIDMRKRVISNAIRDMRKTAKKILKDFRKIARLKKKCDLNGRDFAIAIVNGEVFSGDTHGEAITKYLKELGVDGISVYDRDELESIMGYGFKSQFAAAHAKEDTIYLEPETLENISIEQAANLIKDKYPGYKIINVDTNERIAKILINKKMKKISVHGTDDRDCAIAYVNGNFYEDYTHSLAVNQYLENNELKTLDYDYVRPNMNTSNDMSDEYNEAVNIIKSIDKAAFAHKVNGEKAIYIESNSLNNIDINTAAKLFKEQYPDYTIYDDSSYSGYDNYYCDNYEYNKYKKIGRIIRLKKIAYHTDYERDCAIVYINGEFYEDATHASAINQYLENHNLKTLNDDYIRPGYSNKQDDGHLEDLDTMKNNVEQIAFAHKLEDNKDIYIEEESLQNIDINTVGKLFKEQYPDYTIYNDDSFDGEDYDENGNSNYDRVAKKMIDLRAIKASRLKKLAWHDIADRDNALAYIDGEIVEAETHAECISIYLEDEFNLSLNEEQMRPNINIEVDDAWDDNQAKDLQNIYDNIKQICFGHVDNTNKTIYLEPNGLNVSINDLTTIGPKIKEKFPDFNIVIDNATNENFQQVAILKKSRLKKISGFHDKNNRTSAIMYLDGEVLEGQDHYDMITQYMKEKYNLDRNDPNQERETDKLFDDLSYAMGSKVDEDKTIYIDDDTLNNVDGQVMIDTIKAKYPDFNVIIETSSNEDMREYYKKYMSEEEYNEYLKEVSNF